MRTSALRQPIAQPGGALPATAAPTTTPAPSPFALDFSRLPARGRNPVSCIPSCATINAAPLSRASLDAAGTRWRDQSLACLASSGPASGAIHDAAIRDNETTELTAEVAREGANRQTLHDYRANLGEICQRKRREIELEYQYNLVFVSDVPPRRWTISDLDYADRAFAAIPPEMTWGNRVLSRYSRGMIHPTQPGVGGETDAGQVQTSGNASVEIFDVGLRPGRMHWAAATGPERPLHTIRHEHGHVLEMQIPQNARDELWNTLMDWREFSWAWISAPRSPGTPSTWTAERDVVMRMVNITTDSAFDAWLSTFTVGALHDIRGRVWSRQMRSNSPFLYSWRAGAIPRGPEFEYARTGKADYFAEVFNYAVSIPDWLHDQLPPEQILWFKRNVFHIPATETEWSTQFAMVRPLSPAAMARLMRTFTWQQAQPILDAAMQEHVA